MHNHFDTLEKRFLAKVTKIPETGCWIWTGARTKRGHGIIKIDHAVVYARRASWIISFGPIPENMHIVHKEECKDPANCVAPHHLTPASHYSEIRKPTHTTKQRKKPKRLTVEMVAEIKTSDEPQATLANRYGVTDGAVNHIKSGRRWKHVV